MLCKLARVVGGSDPLDEAREWFDGYRHEAKRLSLSLGQARPVRVASTRCAAYPYSKRQINLWLSARWSACGPETPLRCRRARRWAIDGKGGGWTSITHLATYVRWGRDQPATISSEALAGRVVELGAERWTARAWDATTRQRQDRIVTVLVRLPDPQRRPPRRAMCESRRYLLPRDRAQRAIAYRTDGGFHTRSGRQGQGAHTKTAGERDR